MELRYSESVYLKYRFSSKMIYGGGGLKYQLIKNWTKIQVFYDDDDDELSSKIMLKTYMADLELSYY